MPTSSEIDILSQPLAGHLDNFWRQGLTHKFFCKTICVILGQKILILAKWISNAQPLQGKLMASASDAKDYLKYLVKMRRVHAKTSVHGKSDCEPVNCATKLHDQTDSIAQAFSHLA